MSEATFTTWVIQTAEALGWRVYHVPFPVRPIGDGKFVPEPRARGMCDLQMFHSNPPRMILAELKDTAGKLSAEQHEYLLLARAVADSMRMRLTGLGEVLAANGIRSELTEGNVPIGVYTWRPGLEALIEATLRSKVLTRQ